MMSDSATFDEAMRTRWRAAQANVSAATIAQLHRRRIAAGSGHPARGFNRDKWLAACCMVVIPFVFLWVMGMVVSHRFDSDTEDANPPASAQVSVPDAAPAAADITTAIDVLDAFDSINLTALDEEPDFLDWLASDESGLLAAY